jgi:hypothetical protein
MLSLCIVVVSHIAVNNIKLLNVAMVKQELFLFSLLSGYKIFPTAVNNINVLRSSCNVTDIFVQF